MLNTKVARRACAGGVPGMHAPSERGADYRFMTAPWKPGVLVSSGARPGAREGVRGLSFDCQC